MAAPMSTQQRNGRYTYGGYTDVNGTKLGWWDRTTFTKDSSDISFPLVKKYAKRPDLVAFDMYGSANLQWFVMQYNNISDLTVEFVEGTIITLPTRGRLLGEMLVTVPQPTT